MSNDDIALLKADNARLNKLIAILIDQNELIRRENEWLKIHIGLKEQDMPDIKIQEAFTEFWKSHIQMNVGHTGLGQPYAQMYVGQKESVQPNVQMLVGQSQQAQPDKQMNIGQSDGIQPDIQMYVGLTGQKLPSTQMYVGQTEENIPLPPVIEPSGILISSLVKTLKAAGFKHAEVSTVRNAATLMVHFYNKGGGSYPELKKITNLSIGGLSKFMTSFRRRGLIKRYAFQKFELTPQGLNLLQQAYSKIKR